MSPPIRDGSGNDIGSIRLGDGSEISEVRTGAGDVLFSAIPDSVVTQFSPSTYSNGDSTWTDDVGSNDISITGDPQRSTFSDGTNSIEGDGADDFGAFNIPTEWNGDSIEVASIEWELQTTDSTNARWWGVDDSTLNTQRIACFGNNDVGFNGTVGQFVVVVEDDNGSRLDMSPSSNPNLNDGNKHKVSVIFNDLTNNDVSIIIDGSSVAVDTEFNGKPTAFKSWGDNMRLWDLNNSSVPIAADIGLFRLHDINISSQTI